MNTFHIRCKHCHSIFDYTTNRNLCCLFSANVCHLIDPIEFDINVEMIFAHRYKPTNIYLLRSCSRFVCLELFLLVDILLGKLSSLKNNWIIFRFVYAWPCPICQGNDENVCTLNKQLAIIIPIMSSTKFVHIQN